MLAMPLQLTRHCAGFGPTDWGLLLLREAALLLMVAFGRQKVMVYTEFIRG